jgi:hypothetical protein
MAAVFLGHGGSINALDLHWKRCRHALMPMSGRCALV